MKVAFVYDRVNKWGGAERVLLGLHELFPDAPLYTAVYHPQMAPWAKEFKVIPSFLNKFPLAKSRHEAYPHLMPLAFESFDFSGYDVVLSITSEAAKGIITKPETLHLCYCLTPTRYLWSGYQEYFQNKAFRFLTKPIVLYLRSWDKIAAQRPDVYLTISENVKKRINKYYSRNSEVIYPPVDLKKFQILPQSGIPLRGTNSKFQTNSKFKIQNSKFFLVVSRLDFGYKKVDLAIEAFNQLGLPLKIIGTGTQMRNLKRKAKKNIEFLGQLTDKELLGYYGRCQAVIFPQEEDFGLVPLEAQACGKPVIAYRGGGALETVREGPTGVFFSPQTAEALVKTVANFRPEKFDPDDCRRNTKRFSQERFKKKIKRLIEKEWKKTK